jgi:hypothetical protein
MEKINLFKKFEIPSLNKIIPSLKPKKMDKVIDEIKIRGYVQFVNGPKKTRWYRNHFVNGGLIELVNLFAANQLAGVSDVPAVNWAARTDGFIVLGTNTTTPTTQSMTQLVNPIGTAPGTKPNTQTGMTGTLSNGYYVIYQATWNTNTVSGTVGEVGLYARGYSNLVSFGQNLSGVSIFMFSRLSVADGDFQPQTINTSYPFTVNWQLSFTYS